MLRKVIVIGLICLFLIGIISCAAPRNKETIAITAKEFLKGGPSNKYLASQYFGKIFRVSGKIDSINSCDVQLGPSQGSDRVHCLFLSSNEVKNLGIQIGQRIVIQGELAYPYPGLEGPTLQDCKIVSKK